jgi:hydrogenase maturation factor
MTGWLFLFATVIVKVTDILAAGISGSVWFSVRIILMYSVPEQSVHGVYNKLQNNLKKILNPML